jgi:hypothetical protein
MEDRGYKHRIVGSETTSTQGKDGYWTVIGKMFERVSNDGEVWEEAIMEVMEIDSDLEKAFVACTAAIVNMFNYDVLEKGFVSLIDAKRSSEEKGNGTESKDIQN